MTTLKLDAPNVMSRLVILTADDFGLARSVDSGILKLVDAGIVSAVSILVESVHQEALERLREHPNAPALGLHVDVTDSLLRYDPSRSSPQEIRRRMRAQLDKFVALVGGVPAHLDTHKHKHAEHPEVLRELLSLVPGTPVRACDRRLRRILSRKHVPHSDACIGGAGMKPFWTRPQIDSVLRTLKPGVTEWVCHPAFFDSEHGGQGVKGSLPEAVKYRGQRGVEYVHLLASDFKDRLRANDVELVHWRSLRTWFPKSILPANA